jgi:hypothetical protein
VRKQTFMFTDSAGCDNPVHESNNANNRYLVPQQPRKRRKTSSHATDGINPNTHKERGLPSPQLTPKIVLPSSVLADVYAHGAASSDQTSAPLRRMFSHNGSTELKSTLLNNTTLTIQFSSCILPARDDIQLVCKTN